MSYYYMTKTGKFVDSSRPIEDKEYIRLGEHEYAITRLIMQGYTRDEIARAVDKVFSILADEEKENS